MTEATSHHDRSRAGHLAGKVALVTGAGRGIGAAITRKLVLEGAKVLACDLDEQPLKELSNQLQESPLPGELELMVGDVTEETYGERVVETALHRFGGLVILVNNAGYIWNTTIQKMTDEQWYAMLDVHLTAPFRILRAATPYLKEATAKERADGLVVHRKVVNVSSISGVYGAATQLAYASAKAGVVGMTKTLAKEWGRYLVNVNCVAFGFIDTRLTQTIPAEGATIDVQGKELKVGLSQPVRAHLDATIPLGRPGTATEAAGAVYLLCTPESDYISGHCLICDGGGP